MRVFSKVNVVLRVCTRNYGFTAIRREYGPEAVEKLRGSLKIEQTLARRGAERLWELINRGEGSYVNALGAMTGTRKEFLKTDQNKQKKKLNLTVLFLSDALLKVIDHSMTGLVLINMSKSQNMYHSWHEIV